MAGKIVDIVFQLKDNVTGGLGKIKSSLAESNKQLTRAGKQITQFGKQMERTGQTVTKSITVPIVGAGAVAVKKFADVDKTMSLVNSTMKNGAEEADLLNKAMSDAAANSTFGMNDAAEAALNFARGGWNAEQAAEALAPAMNLAAGEGGNLETVSAGLMATMNSFGASAKEAQSYADVFANACNNSALDVNSLSDAMSVAAPIFKTGGLGVQDAALAMGVMANAGVDANVAANSLKTGMARLASPAKQGAAWMERLGIEAFDANGNMKDMTTLQGELSRTFGELTAQEKEAAASAIFGKNNMSSWLSLIGAAPADVKKLSDSLGESGTAADMSTAMMSGFGGSIEKLKSSFDVFMTNMGKPIGEVLTPFIEKIQGVIDKLNGMDDAQKKQIVKFALLAASVGPALIIFGKLTVGIGKVAMIMGKVGKAFQMGRAVLTLLNAPGLAVIGVLAGIAAAAIIVWKNWDKIKAVMSKVVKALMPVINQFKKNVTDLRKTFVTAFLLIKSSVLNAFHKIAGTVNNIKKHFNQLAETPAFQKFISMVQNFFVDKLKAAFNIMHAVFTGVFTAITGIVSGAIDTMGSVLNGFLTMLDGIIQFITGVFSGNWKSAWEGVKKIFGGAFESLAGLAKQPLNAVISLINGAIAGLNKIKVDIPDWVPEFGGQTFGLNIPTIPKLEVGTPSWVGGLAMIHDKGGEIVDLPRGSRVYPHDQSVKRAYNDGRRSGSVAINIPKLADQIVIREDADIDRLTAALTNKLRVQLANVG